MNADRAGLRYNSLHKFFTSSWGRKETFHGAQARVLAAAGSIRVAGASVAVAQAATGARSHGHGGGHGSGHGHGSGTATPIKHVVVIFQENESFDHYFGTYPKAANTDGRRFHAAPRARRRSTV